MEILVILILSVVNGVCLLTVPLLVQKAFALERRLDEQAKEIATLDEALERFMAMAGVPSDEKQAALNNGRRIP